MRISRTGLFRPAPPGRGATGATGTWAWASVCPPCATPMTRRSVGPFPPRGFPPLPRCRVGGGAPEGAGLRPPLKRHVRFSRMPLSRRHVGEMRAKGNSGVDPLRTRQVEPGPQSPRTMMYGFFARKRTDPPRRPSSSGVPTRPFCLRPPPSPTHSSRRSLGHAGFAALQVLCSGPTTGRASRPTSLPLIGLLTPVLLGPCQSS